MDTKKKEETAWTREKTMHAEGEAGRKERKGGGGGRSTKSEGESRGGKRRKEREG